MKDVATYKITEAFQKNYDPTHTTVLRNQWAREMRRRFVEIQKAVKTSIVDNDCFGLKKEKIALHQVVPISKEAFKYNRSSEKVLAFMNWLQDQVNKGILDIRVFQQIGSSVDAAWTNLYVFDSYKRGILRAMYELKKAGYEIPSDYERRLQISLNNPFHVDRLGLLYTRVFTDLKGITDAMDSQISRILAQGMADGDNPIKIARKIISTINGEGADKLGITDTLGRFIPGQRRAIMLARTEVIRAHHVAMIQEYRNWGLLDIFVQAEWKTAGDDRVCDKCSHLEGKIFPLDEIESMIPAHPMCRCIALPYIKGL